MEEQTKINVGEELARARKAGNIWKPEEGTHTISFLDEPELASYTNPETREVKQQVRLSVDPGGSGKGPTSWFIGRGVKPKSIWRQLLEHVAAKNNESFIGCQVTIKVLGNGKERTYTLV